MGPIASEGLGALAARGFRFSLDHVGDLRLEPRDLADRGFRFVKAPAGLLLNRNAAAAADIDPADLVGLLGRFGIDLIAEKIERESTVVDLLDYDVRLGQGNLFSPPRAVRPDVLQGMEQREIEASALSAAESGEAAADAGEAARARSGPSGPGSAFVRLARGMIARN
jgi:cyclic-di-GMP phosphodiesterase TipF (flagellum assembly factor)